MKAMRRKPISKKMRQLVYEKYNGHCAYCGKEIEMKDMQVDHVVAVAKYIYGSEEERAMAEAMHQDGSINGIDNLMPACRSCNFYKSDCSLDTFRWQLSEVLDHTCRDSFQVRLAMQYGMLEYHPWDGKFYFEKQENNITSELPTN